MYVCIYTYVCTHTVLKMVLNVVKRVTSVCICSSESSKGLRPEALGLGHVSCTGLSWPGLKTSGLDFYLEFGNFRAGVFEGLRGFRGLGDRGLRGAKAPVTVRELESFRSRCAFEFRVASSRSGRGIRGLRQSSNEAGCLQLNGISGLAQTIIML